MNLPCMKESLTRCVVASRVYAGCDDLITKEITNPLVSKHLKRFLETKPRPNSEGIELHRIFRRRLHRHILDAASDAASNSARMQQLEYGFLFEFMRARPSGSHRASRAVTCAHIS